MLDILIKKGVIIDGSGDERYKGDIGIKGGKIKCINCSCQEKAKEIIEAEGFIVTPGFIDFHSHSDITLLYETRATNMLGQGITTELTGHCGMTLTPKVDEIFLMIKPNVDNEKFEELGRIAETVSGFMDYIGNKKIGTNIAFLIGHGAVRAKVLGFENRKPTKIELEKMKDIVREAMEAGAFGMSTGLIYPPGVYAIEDELVELCKVVAEYGGIYASHMRSEGNWIIESVKETIRIGEKAGVPVVISHHKISGKQNWGKSKETLKLIEDANERGVKVRLDQYPYKAGATDLISALPPKYAVDGPIKLVEKLKDEKVRKEMKEQLMSSEADFENLIYGSGFEGVLILNAPKTNELSGKTIAQIAEILDKDPYDTIFDLIIENKGEVGAAYFTMNDEDIERIMKHELVMGGTDSTHVSEKNPAGHPRYTGAFVKILSTYVRDKKIIEIEEAIRKLTSLPADMAGLTTKGLLKEGYDADIVILDYENLKANSNFSNPSAPNEGVKYVIVNGKVAVKNDTITGICAGKVIKR